MSRKEGGSNPQAGGGVGQPAYHPRTPLKSNMTLTPLLRPSVAPGPSANSRAWHHGPETPVVPCP